MRVAALATLALVSCWPAGDDPWGGLESDACSPGNSRSGAACTVTAHAFAIDGATTDWEGVDEIAVSPTCESCDGLAPEAIQLASRDDGWLAIHVRMLGGVPLRDDPSVAFVVELTATDEFPSPERDRVIVSGGNIEFRKNDYVVDPPARVTPFYVFEWTPDGFEVAIDSGIFPFPAGARIAVYATRADQPVSSSKPIARACWLSELIVEGTDRKSEFKQDPCRSRAP